MIGPMTFPVPYQNSKEEDALREGTLPAVLADDVGLRHERRRVHRLLVDPLLQEKTIQAV